MNFQHFDGLYGELNASPASDYIFSELISTRSEHFNWVIRPHIHTKLFQLFMVESGKVTLKSDFQEKPLVSPCLIVIPPAILHGLTYSSDVKGHIVTISSSIIENIFQSLPILSLTRPLLLEEFNEECSFEKLQMLIKNIDEELFGDLPERRLMLQTYITQLFVTLQRMLNLEEDISDGKNSMIHHFRKFQRLLKMSDYPKSIPQFAQELNISHVHLNRVCQSIVGKSALQIIQEYLIEESKKYLEYTSHSVSEIAYLLKFEYPNYFAKLFKKYMGMSPKEFRMLCRK